MDTIEPTAVKTNLKTSRKASASLWERLIKRAFDLVVSALGLLFFSPFFLWTAIRLKRESPGPVFYRGPRLGRHGKVFQILKFRTMYERPESYNGSAVTAEDDARITPLGRKLRDSKINELPQLWSVFVGEMSFVGPRPEDPQIARTWPREVFNEILSVRPGITSPASVVYRHEEKMLHSDNVMDVYLQKILPDKQRLDLLYVRTHTFLSDLDVIFATLVTFFPSVEKAGIHESRLFSGLLSNFVTRYLTWFLVDFLVAFIAAGLVGLLNRLSGPLDLGWGLAVLAAAVMALLFSLVNAVLGLGNVFWQRASPRVVFDLIFSAALVTGLIFMVNWFFPGGRLFPPAMVIETGVVALFGFIATRYRQRLLTGFAARWLLLRPRTAALGERALIIGAGDCGELAGWLLQKSSLENRISVIGMVDDDPQKFNLRIGGYRVLGSTRDLPTLVGKHNIGIILFAITSIAPQERERIVALCRSLPVRLVLIPDLIHILQKHLLAEE